MYKLQRLFLFMVVLFTPLASASAKPNCKFDDILRFFSDPPPRTKCYKSSWLKSVALLNSEQRDQIAVLAARSMLREPDERIAYYATLIADLNRERLITTAKVVPFLNEFAVLAGKSISQGSSASFYAERLRILCASRLITTPDVLPYLIETLDNPDPSVARPAFDALTALTLHTTGRFFLARSVEDPIQHRLITQWWKDWWDKNKNRRPVFDLELEAAVKAEVIMLATAIKENLRPKFSEMSYFIIPEFRLIGQPPLYVIAYSPHNYHFISKPPNIENVWLCMEADFQTRDLPDEGSTIGAEPGSFFDPRYPPLHLKNLEQEIYFRTIPGTDVFIRVRFASNNQTLIDALRRLMKQTIDNVSR